MARAHAPRTKIVCTIGPACDNDRTLEQMVRAGLSVARINLAHGSYADHARFAARVRAAAKRVGRTVAIMVDLAGPKIRIGEVPNGRLSLENGQRLLLSTEARPRRGIPVTEPRLSRDLRPGDPIFVADGTIELITRSVRGKEIECGVVNGGLLLSHKGVNVPATRLHVPGLTPRDRRDLRHALDIGVDAVALSFVRNVADVRRLRRVMGTRQVPIIAKIEKREAIEDLDGIVDAADGVMVARGDLAVETSLEELPLLQKRIIRTSNAAAKPVITATQMLLSMVENPRPTRAEAGDVANAILDGTDAVMLSEETARGKHPVRAVETMARIALQAERGLDATRFRHASDRLSGVALSVSTAAVDAASSVGAKAIVTPTFGGATPRFVARLRPAVPVLALTQSSRAVQYLCFTWGVHPVHVSRMGQLEATLRQAGEHLRALGLIGPGDRYVVTAGYPVGQASNLMTVQTQPLGRKRRPRRKAK